METLRKLPVELQVILGATAAYVLFSFFDWQQVSAFGVSAGVSEWEGIGVLAALLAIVVLAWEAARIVVPELKVGSIEPALVSAALAAGLVLFTVITFLTHNEARHWPAWAGLLLSLVVGAAAALRAREEGLQLPSGRPTHHPGPQV